MRALESITGYVIYNPAYTYKLQLKTTKGNFLQFKQANIQTQSVLEVDNGTTRSISNADNQKHTELEMGETENAAHNRTVDGADTGVEDTLCAPCIQYQ